MCSISTKHLKNSTQKRALQEKILKNWFEMKKQYHLGGTPAYIIDGEVHNYALSFEEFEKIYEKRLQQHPELAVKKRSV